MAHNKNFLDAIKKGIKNIKDKIVSNNQKNTTKPIDPNYKIKYDGSDKEMELLGLTQNGSAIASERNRLNLYLKEVERRQTIRESSDFETLKKQGIVAQDGEVIDEQAFEKYIETQFMLKHQYHGIER